jgi:hypothetical protein
MMVDPEIRSTHRVIEITPESSMRIAMGNFTSPNQGLIV